MTDYEWHDRTDPVGWDRETILKILAQLRSDEEEEQHQIEWSPKVASYIQEEMAGRDPATEHPETHQHLQVCSACGEAYAELIELERQHRESELAKPGRYPSTIDLRPAGLGVLDKRTGEWLSEEEIRRKGL